MATAAAAPFEGTVPFSAEFCAATGIARLLRGLARGRVRSAGAVRALPSCAQKSTLDGSARHAIASNDAAAEPCQKRQRFALRGTSSRRLLVDNRTCSALASRQRRACAPSSECARASELQS